MYKQKLYSYLLIVLLLGIPGSSIIAATTINPANSYAYSANTGWINARGDVTNGAVIGRFYCSGYLYSANCGWISLGSGTPTNGYTYGNSANNDYGINHDGNGNLSGYAYGANIGWINFEQTYGKPKVDLATGNLSGYAWSANTGWISLSNAQAFVQTDSLNSGPDSDADGIPDAWEYREAGNLTNLSTNGDADNDGATDTAEYLADTDPQDSGDRLIITAISAAGSTNSITWDAKTTRSYTLMQTEKLSTNTTWTAVTAPIIPTTTPITKTVTGLDATSHFYRVNAAPPLE